jgi:2-(1,2-epoxy-1,2-dihydrophenyl)acetyl-CoA isomerase
MTRLPQYDKIRVSLDDGVALITLNDPGALNAAGLEMGRDLSHALRAIAAGVIPARAIVLTGEGRGFCSGANLSGGGPASRQPDVDGKPDAGAGLESDYNPLVTLFRDSPVPIVTAVNGVAAGIGCSLALLGDMVVAADSAYFLQAFCNIGLVPDGGSTYLLPRAIGRARAMEMVLMGGRIPAAKALEWGLINRCVPQAEVLSASLEIARALADGPHSLSLIRQLVWESLDNGWIQQLHAERKAQKIAGKTEDYIEGVTAFREKRSAVFSGR